MAEIKLEGSQSARVTRRDLLRMGVAGAAAAGLSGCGANDDAQVSGPPPPLIRPTGVEDGDWAAVRAQFLTEPGISYLNNASLGMPPRQVVDAVASGYRVISEEPLHGKHDLQDRIAEHVLPGLARLFRVRESEINLTRNASEALHLQTIGATLAPGDEVLITTQEHPAGRRPWLFRAAREGVRVTEVAIPSPLPTPGEVVALLERAVTPRTRALAFCHVTRGGHLYPVRDICEMARNRGLVSLVDGAQAVGQFPIDVQSLGCDAYSASLHKWMLAPTGTGFLFVREDARDRIVTAFSYDATPSDPAFEPPGTADFPVRAAIAAALDFVGVLGMERIEERCRYLSDHLKNRLSELPRVTLLSGPADRSAPGSTIFELDGLDALDAVSMMERRASAHIDEHQRDGHNAIRISTHVYNTKAEIDRVVEVLSEA